MRSLVLLTMLALSLVAFGPVQPAQAAPECSEKTLHAETVFGGVAVATSRDCTADVSAFRGIDCVGAWTTHIGKDVGPVRVDAWMCTLPWADDPVAPDCKAQRVGVIEVTENCRVVVDLDLVDCLWDERRVEKKVGPVTVIYTYCGNGSDPR